MALSFHSTLYLCEEMEPSFSSSKPEGSEEEEAAAAAAAAAEAKNKKKNNNSRARHFDEKARALCWQKAEVLRGRHPERWRKDSAGNVVCRKFTNCDGCLCHEYDHILPFSKGELTFCFLNPRFHLYTLTLSPPYKNSP